METGRSRFRQAPQRGHLWHDQWPRFSRRKRDV